MNMMTTPQTLTNDIIITTIIIIPGLFLVLLGSDCHGLTALLSADLMHLSMLTHLSTDTQTMTQALSYSIKASITQSCCT